MKKPLIIISEDTKLNEIFSEFGRTKEMFLEKSMFIHKQLKNIENDAKQAHQKYWTLAEERLRELGKITSDMEDPDIEMTDGTLYLLDKKNQKHSNPLEALIEMLTKIK